MALTRFINHLLEKERKLSESKLKEGIVNEGSDNDAQEEKLETVKIDIATVKRSVFSLAQMISDECAKVEAELSRDTVLNTIADVANRLFKHKDTFAGKLKSVTSMKSPKLFDCGMTLSSAPAEFRAALYSAKEIGEVFKNDEIKKIANKVINLFNLSNPSLEQGKFQQLEIQLQQELAIVIQYSAPRTTI